MVEVTYLNWIKSKITLFKTQPLQKCRGFLVADVELGYYLKTDVKIYNEVKRKYLSKKWVDADEETEIKERYHNIVYSKNDHL